jgi:hypothetical protein
VGRRPEPVGQELTGGDRLLENFDGVLGGAQLEQCPAKGRVRPCGPEGAFSGLRKFDCRATCGQRLLVVAPTASEPARRVVDEGPDEPSASPARR